MACACKNQALMHPRMSACLGAHFTCTNNVNRKQVWGNGHKIDGIWAPAYMQALLCGN